MTKQSLDRVLVSAISNSALFTQLRLKIHFITFGTFTLASSLKIHLNPSNTFRAFKTLLVLLNDECYDFISVGRRKSFVFGEESWISFCFTRK